MKKAFLSMLLAGLALGAVIAPVHAKDEVITVYSGRKEALIAPVIRDFTRETGIRVVLRTGGASELANAVMEEGAGTRADAFIANDAGTLEVLRAKGLLAPHNSPNVRAVPRDLRADDGSWVGLSARARVIMYNRNLVKPNELPSSVLDLADPKWKGQVALASSANESLIAHVTGLRGALGERGTEDFLRSLIRNKAVSLKGHTEVRKAVGSGEFKLGLVNHYYYHLQREEGSPVGVIYPDQGAGGMGALVNVAGAGIIRHSKRQEAAKAFVDYLLSDDAQIAFAKDNFEMPVVKQLGVPGVPALNGFKRMRIELEALGGQLPATLDLIERVALP